MNGLRVTQERSCFDWRALFSRKPESTAYAEIASACAGSAVKTDKLRGRAIVRGGAGTAARTIGLFRGILTYAVELGIIEQNPHAACSATQLPDQVRARVGVASAQFRVGATLAEADDPRIPALAAAIRLGHQVRLDARSNAPRHVHPVALIHDAEGWSVVDGPSSERIAISEWKDINVSGLPRR
jgi:hypothetical protein